MIRFRMWLASKIAPKQFLLVKGQKLEGEMRFPSNVKNLTLRDNIMAPGSNTDDSISLSAQT